MRRQPPESREVSLGPGIPRVTLEPLDLPAAEPSKVAEPAEWDEQCWFCRGGGCDVCDGSGKKWGTQ